MPKNKLMSLIQQQEEIDDNLKNLVMKEAGYFDKILQNSAEINEQQLDEWRQETVLQRRIRVANVVFQQFNGTIKYGPFKGQKLIDNPWWGTSDKASMILGVYEKEVLDFLTSDLFKNKKSFIDVGAADGYYAIGLIKNNYFDHCYCFEMSQEGQNIIKRSADENNLSDRVSIYGTATSEFYKEIPKDNFDDSVILIDIEGAEFEILESKCLSAISNATVIIEIHNWIEDFEIKYFKLLVDASKYFSVSFLSPAIKNMNDFDELNHLSDDNRYLICSEGRPNAMRFMVLTPK